MTKQSTVVVLPELVKNWHEDLKHYEDTVLTATMGVPTYQFRRSFRGVPMADKGFFTYCVKHRSGRSHMNWNRRSYPKQYGHGYALAFDAEIFEKRSFQNVASSIAGIPLLRKLFPAGFLVVKFYGKNYAGGSPLALVATDSSWMVPSMDEQEAEVGLFTHNEQLTVGHFTDTSELIRTCYSIERVVNACADCQRNREECTRERLLKWAETKNIPRSDLAFLSAPADEVTSVIDQYDEEELDELLRNHSENSVWEYVHPNKTTDKVRKDSLRGVFYHDLHRVKEYQEKRSEASRKAAETRSCLRICEAECVFAPTCTWVNGSCKFGIRDCHGINQGSSSYFYAYGGGGAFPAGPFRQNDVDRAIDWYLENKVGIDPVMLRMWSTIAYNAGVHTRATGRPMTLCGINSSFDGVVFVTDRTRRDPVTERKEFSFKDALRILRMPYIENYEYRKARGIAEPPRLLNRDELALYTEIIQRTHLAGYSAGMCGRITPFMKYAEWDPEQQRFIVCGVSGYNHWVSKLCHILTAFEELPKCVKFIPESVETRCQVSSPGTHP